MKLVLNSIDGVKEFEVNKRPNLGDDTISFSLVVDDTSAIPSTITGDVVLKDTIKWPKTGPVEEGEDPLAESEEQDFILYQTTVESWLRYYTSGNNLFFTNVPVPPPPPEPTPEEIEAERLRQLAIAKDNKIAQSKAMLSDYLKSHPLAWTDGNKYSVTQEKQSQLTSNIALYQIAVAAGQPYELKWNTTGDVCTEWTIENLSALALAIGAYVQPLVSYQQTTEVAIKECKFMSELDAIVINYDSVHNPTESGTTKEPTEPVEESGAE